MVLFFCKPEPQLCTLTKILLNVELCDINFLLFLFFKKNCISVDGLWRMKGAPPTARQPPLLVVKLNLPQEKHHPPFRCSQIRIVFRVSMASSGSHIHSITHHSNYRWQQQGADGKEEWRKCVSWCKCLWFHRVFTQNCHILLIYFFNITYVEAFIHHELNQFCHHLLIFLKLYTTLCSMWVVGLLGDVLP